MILYLNLYLSTKSTLILIPDVITFTTPSHPDIDATWGVTSSSHILFFAFLFLFLFSSSSFFPYFSPLLLILTSPYGWNQARGWNFALGGWVVSWHGLASLYHPHRGPAVCLLDDRLGHRQGGGGGGGQHPLVYAILSSSWDINLPPLLWCF